jgi:hypothetical protein
VVDYLLHSRGIGHIGIQHVHSLSKAALLELCAQRIETLSGTRNLRCAEAERDHLMTSFGQINRD